MTVFSRSIAAADAVPTTMPTVQVLDAAGVPVWLIQDDSVPVVSVQFVFRDAGSISNPAGKEGLSSMTAALLTEGAGDLDSTAFAAELESRAIRLSFDAGRDTFTGSLQTLKENLGDAVALTKLALQQPRFDDDAIERVRQQTASMIAYRQQTPGAVASKAWWEAAYPGHPYGLPPEGTLESLATINRKNLQQFLQQNLAKSNLLVGIAGDITPEAATKLVEQLFADLPDVTQPLPEGVLPAPEIAAGSAEPVIIHRPIPQATAKFGHKGLRRDDPDYFAAVLLNHILGGGGFSARLMEEVREKRGLTYGISTGMPSIGEEGLLVGGLASENVKMQQALVLTRQIWQEMASSGVTGAELEDARSYINGSFPLSLDSTAKLAGLLTSMQYYHLGSDYLERRAGLVDAVTVEDIKAMAQRLLKSDNLLVVIVGDEKAIKASN